MQSIAYVIIEPKLWNICINYKTINTLLEHIVLIVLCRYKGLLPYNVARNFDVIVVSKFTDFGDHRFQPLMYFSSEAFYISYIFNSHQESKYK